MMRPPQKGEFWYQTSDAAMRKWLWQRLGICIVVGTAAWFVGHAVLRALIPR